MIKNALNTIIPLKNAFFGEFRGNWNLRSSSHSIQIIVRFLRLRELKSHLLVRPAQNEQHAIRFGKPARRG